MRIKAPAAEGAENHADNRAVRARREMETMIMRLGSGMRSALLGGAAALLLAGGAAAQGEAPRGKQAGDFLIGLGAIGVLPQGGGSVGLIGGRPEASNSASPQLDFTYFIFPQMALNLIAASTQHDISVQDSALGNVKLGHVWVLPPTLTVQWHPLPQARLSPYVGVGVNMTFFYGYGGEKTPPVNRVRVDNTAAVAFVAGVDYEITPHWLANFDVKRILLEPSASVNSGLIHARVNLDPWVVGAGLRYRF